jgi:hypothetical protein
LISSPAAISEFMLASAVEENILHDSEPVENGLIFRENSRNTHRCPVYPTPVARRGRFR